jgi:hypothetical protein
MHNREMIPQSTRFLTVSAWIVTSAEMLAANPADASSEPHIKTVWGIVMENQNWASIKATSSFRLRVAADAGSNTRPQSLAGRSR